jgi:hypothetical protein
VEVGTGVDERNIVSPYYAVAQDGVVVPEYVVDRYGNYPTTREEAWRRFHNQKDQLQPLVQAKYDLTRGGASGVSRNVMGFFFTLVSPVAIPIRYLGEAFGPKDKRRSFGEVASEYFDLSFHPPGFQLPRIRERIDILY